jgi:hypothetical protein
LKLKWASDFANGTSAYGQPTVTGGRVYVGSDNGFVSLDAASGCVLVLPVVGRRADGDRPEGGSEICGISAT